MSRFHDLYPDYAASVAGAAPVEDGGILDAAGRGLRSGFTGLHGQLQAAAGLAAENMGATDFANARYARARELSTQAGEEAPRIGRWADVNGLREGLEFGAGIAGGLVPSLAAGVGGALLTRGNPLIGSTLATAIPEGGEVVQRQLTDPASMAMSAGERGEAALGGGLASGFVNSALPARLVSQALGRTARAANAAGRTLPGIAGNAAIGVGMEGTAEGVGEAIKQRALMETSGGTEYDTDAIREAAIAGAIGGGLASVPGAVAEGAHARLDRAGTSLGDVVRDSTAAAQEIVAKGLDKAKAGLAGAKAKGKEALGAAKEKADEVLASDAVADAKAQVKKGVDWMGDLVERNDDVVVDTMAEGDKLIDPLPDGVDPKAHVAAHDNTVMAKARDIATRMMNAADLSPENRARAKEMYNNVADPVVRQSLALWEKGKRAGTRLAKFARDMKTEFTTAADAEGVKKSADTSGAQNLVMQEIRGAIEKNAPYILEDEEAMQNLTDGILAYVDAAKNDKRPERLASAVANLRVYLGDEGLRVLTNAFEKIHTATPKEREKFYDSLQRYDEEATTQNKLVEVVRKGRISRDFNENDAVEVLRGYVRGDHLKQLAGPEPEKVAQRAIREKIVRQGLQKMFGGNLEKVLAPFEREFEASKLGGTAETGVSPVTPGAADVDAASQADTDKAAAKAEATAQNLDVTEITPEPDRVYPDTRTAFAPRGVHIKRFGITRDASGKEVDTPDDKQRKRAERDNPGRAVDFVTAEEYNKTVTDEKDKVKVPSYGNPKVYGVYVARGEKQESRLTQEEADAIRADTGYHSKEARIPTDKHGVTLDAVKLTWDAMKTLPYIDGESKPRRIARAFLDGLGGALVHYDTNVAGALPDDLVVYKSPKDKLVLTYGDIRQMKDEGGTEMSLAAKTDIASDIADMKKSLQREPKGTKKRARIEAQIAETDDALDNAQARVESLEGTIKTATGDALKQAAAEKKATLDAMKDLKRDMKALRRELGPSETEFEQIQDDIERLEYAMGARERDPGSYNTSWTRENKDGKVVRRGVSVRTAGSPEPTASEIAEAEGSRELDPEGNIHKAALAHEKDGTMVRTVSENAVSASTKRTAKATINEYVQALRARRKDLDKDAEGYADTYNALTKRIKKYADMLPNEEIADSKPDVIEEDLRVEGPTTTRKKGLPTGQVGDEIPGKDTDRVLTPEEAKGQAALQKKMADEDKADAEKRKQADLKRARKQAEAIVRVRKDPQKIAQAIVSGEVTVDQMIPHIAAKGALGQRATAKALLETRPKTEAESARANEGLQAVNRLLRGELKKKSDVAYAFQHANSHSIDDGTMYSRMAADIHADLGKQGIPATHDSPIRHEGKFDWRTHKGKGEGNAAFGAGLYLSTADSVHRAYKDMFSRTAENRYVRALRLAFTRATNNLSEAEAEAKFDAVKEKLYADAMAQGKKAEARGFRNVDADAASQAAWDKLRTMTYAEFKTPPKSPTYQVTINAEPHEMLDWDSKEQSAFVMKVLGLKPDKPGKITWKQETRPPDLDFADIDDIPGPSASVTYWSGDTGNGDLHVAIYDYQEDPFSPKQYQLTISDETGIIHVMQEYATVEEAKTAAGDFMQGYSKNTGEQIYKGLSRVLGSDVAASDHLQSLGIVGHVFNAQGSTNDKHRNYVVYDDARVETNFVMFSKLGNIDRYKEMLDKGHAEIRDGAIYITNTSLLPPKNAGMIAWTDKHNNIVINEVAAQAEIDNGYPHILGTAGGVISAQKALVAKEMGWTLDKLKEIFPDLPTFSAFLRFHEQSHIDNNDREIYPKDFMAPEAIAIEVRASQDALARAKGGSNSPQNADDYIKRVLPQIDVLWRRMAHAGQFRPGKTPDARSTITLSLLSLDPMSTAYHEALHGFFHGLRGQGNHDVMKVLYRAADSAPVMNQLRKLLKHSPKALAQIEGSDPTAQEERVAYMYQFYHQGKLRVGPDAKNRLQKIKDFIMGVLGLWSNDKRAEHIMQWFHEGQFKENAGSPNAVAKALLEPGTNRVIEGARKLAQPLLNLQTALLSTGAERMRDTENPALKQIANLIYPEMGDTTGDVGWTQAARTEHTLRMNEFSTAIKGMTQENIEAAHDALVRGEKGKTPEIERARMAVRNSLDKMFKYMRDAGVDIGDLGYKDNYFPRVWDPEYISRHQEAFKTMLEKNGIRDTDKVIAKIMGTDGTGLDVVVDMPGMQHTKERVLNLVVADTAPFVQKNLFRVMHSYSQQAARRAEWSRRFNDDGSKMRALLDEAKTKHGATQAEIDMAQDYIRGIDGTLGDDISPTMRRIFGNIIVYQNIRLLPLALFSSLVDPMGVMVRGGSMGDAWKTFTRAITEIPRGFKKDKMKDEMYELAELIGTIDDDTLMHTVGTSYTQGMVGEGARKMNDAFFKWNGVEQFTTSTRVGATAAAINFIKRHADGTKSPHSERYMTELGLKESDVIVKNGRPLITVPEFKAHGMSDEEAFVASNKMIGAVNKWVDGAVLRPNSANKPIWMNDPHYALFAHLKQFVYAFQTTILNRVFHEASYGNYGPAMALASYVPMMIAADFIKGMIQGGGEQPEWKKGWGIAEYFSYGVERAGIYGVSQFSSDVLKDLHRGGLGVTAVAGPTVEQLVDSVRVAAGNKEFGDFVMKSLPANALYAEAVRDSPGTGTTGATRWQ